MILPAIFFHKFPSILIETAWAFLAIEWIECNNTFEIELSV